MLFYNPHSDSLIEDVLAKIETELDVIESREDRRDTVVDASPERRENPSQPMSEQAASWRPPTPNPVYAATAVAAAE